MIIIIITIIIIIIIVTQFGFHNSYPLDSDLSGE